MEGLNFEPKPEEKFGKYNWTDERKAKQREKMKQYWAKRKAKPNLMADFEGGSNVANGFGQQ